MMKFNKFSYGAVLWCLCVSVYARKDKDEAKDRCGEVRCVGMEYECIDDTCQCAPGYIPNHFHVRCVKCPGRPSIEAEMSGDVCRQPIRARRDDATCESRHRVSLLLVGGTHLHTEPKHIGLGEKCFSKCCNWHGNESLHCWQGICQPCLDDVGNFICRDSIKEIMLISTAQLAMGAALVLGIIATFILMYKLCATTTIRPLGERNSSNSRLSIGSLQLYIEERLRDAPPTYTRSTRGGPTTLPASTFVNNGFIHDSSIPPPPYSEAIKTEDQPNTAIHI